MDVSAKISADVRHLAARCSTLSLPPWAYFFFICEYASVVLEILGTVVPVCVPSHLAADFQVEKQILPGSGSSHRVRERERKSQKKFGKFFRFLFYASLF